MMKIARKGFTLVELLIVIVVIGVLAAMMMLSSTEAVTSAKAAKVIADMTNMKKAVIAWYTDNFHRVTKEKWNGAYCYKVDGWFLGQFAKDHNGDKEFLRYFSNGKSVKITKDNSTKEGDFFLATEGVDWYVGYDTGDNMALREKIAARAKSVGLLGAMKKVNQDGSFHADTDMSTLATYNTTYRNVYMLIMSFE